MFKKLENGYYSNLDEKFIGGSDLIIYWKIKPFLDKRSVVFEEEGGEINIKIADEKTALLLSRLAYIFNIIDENANIDEFNEFIEVTKGVRIKATLEKLDSSLDEFSAILYLIDNSEKVSIVINEEDEEILRNLINFSAFVGLFSGKIGVFINEDSFSEEFNEFRYFE